MNAIIELGISTIATTIVATNINADNLLTALIGLGVSIVTIVGGEVIKFLVAFLKHKTNKYENKNEEEK